MMSKRFQIFLTIFSLLFIIGASFGIVWDAQRMKEKNELAPKKPRRPVSSVAALAGIQMKERPMTMEQRPKKSAQEITVDRDDASDG